MRRFMMKRLVMLVLVTCCFLPLCSFADTKDAKAHFKAGLAYYDKGQFDEAIAEYKKAIEISPDYAEARSNLGAAYGKKRLFDEAIVEYKEAVKINPNLFEAHVGLGVIYGAWKSLFDEAITEYKEAIRINPKDAEIHRGLAFAYESKHLFDEAITEYKEAIRINPKDADAHYFLGHLYSKRGNLQEAKEYYQKALSLTTDESLKSLIEIGLSVLSEHDAAISEADLAKEGLAMDDFYKILTYYYLNPQPSKLGSILKIMLAKNERVDSPAFGSSAYFFATVAHNDPTFLDSLKQIKESYSGIQKDAIEWMINHAENYKSPLLDSAEHLDYLWAEFSATGKEEPVKKIISAVGQPDIRSGDKFIAGPALVKALVKGAAEWSLVSNAKQHKKVYEIIQREAAVATGELKEKLESILRKSKPR